MLKLELIKKEIKEYIRTPKGIILASLFIFFALSSPALGRYMNEIIAQVAPEMIFDFPEPNLKDSWIQVYKNMSSICIIVYLIVMTGSIAQEKSKGSILLVLTKKVSRFDFIFSKFLVGTLLYTVLFLVSSIISGWYTNVLFGAFIYDGLFVSLFLFWLMGIFFTALAVFVSVIARHQQPQP
jgi:ABC-2 type transport system permease protein